MDSIKILLWESNPLEARRISAALADSGLGESIRRVETCDEFSQALSSERCDVVLAEFRLPSPNAFRALSIAAESCPEAPFIFVSETPGEDIAIEAIKRGAADYVLKQGLDRLASAVRRALCEAAERAHSPHAEERLRLALETVARERAVRVDAEERGRIKDEFLAVLSHDLRTPLNAIVGWATLLLQAPMEPSEVREGLEVIERNARAQTKIISDLLDMNRIISGKVRLAMRPTDLGQEVAAAIQSVISETTAKDLKLETRIERGLPPAQADPLRLRQVIHNLLLHAIKFASRGERIEVRVERAGSDVEIRVVDPLQNTPPESAQPAQERARQHDGSSTHQVGGLSMDMAIAKQLIELHGGSVHVESSDPGHGPRFRVRLPLVPSAGEAVPSDSAAAG